VRKAWEEASNFMSVNRGITLLFIISVGVYVVYNILIEPSEIFIEAKFWLNFLSDISLAIIASFIFYIFIEYIPSKRKEEKFTRIVMNQLKHPITQQVRLLIYIYKASISEKPSVLPTSFEELFDKDYFLIVQDLDFNSQAPVIMEQTWSQYIHQECMLFSRRLEAILIKYSSYLNYDLIKLIEDCSKTLFMRLVLDKGMSRRKDNNVWRHENNIFSHNKLLDGQNLFFRSKLEVENQHILDDHIIKILEIIDLYNKRNPNKLIELDNQLWSDEIAPVYGDSRIDKHI